MKTYSAILLASSILCGACSQMGGFNVAEAEAEWFVCEGDRAETWWPITYTQDLLEWRPSYAGPPAEISSFTVYSNVEQDTDYALDVGGVVYESWISTPEERPDRIHRVEDQSGVCLFEVPTLSLRVSDWSLDQGLTHVWSDRELAFFNQLREDELLWNRFTAEAVFFEFGVPAERWPEGSRDYPRRIWIVVFDGEVFAVR